MSPQHYLNVKYEKEVRLGLAVAMYIDDDRKEVGVNLPPFDYSGRKILSIKDWDEVVAKQIDHVQSLSDATARRDGWIQSTRDDGFFYLDEL